jgi:phage terminase small subunit
VAVSKLTPKQRRFVQEYMRDLNATQAAIRTGYSPDSAESQASRLLSNAKVAAAVAEESKRQWDKIDVETGEILQALRRIAFADLGQAYDKDGKLLKVPEMPPEFRAALAGVEVDELFDWEDGQRNQVGTTSKLKTKDSVKALELLGKYRKLWTDKVDVSGKLTLEQLVAGEGGE